MIQHSMHPDLRPFTTRPPKTFSSERLLFRAMTPDDAPLVFDLYASDPITTKYMSFPRATSPSDSRPFLEGVAASFAGRPNDVRQLAWLIQRKDNGEPIGLVGIGPKSSSLLEGGYVLAQRFWGKGYASEAWGVILSWAQSLPDVQRIAAWHHPDNPASGRVLQKCGMVCEGTVPDHAVLPNISSEKIALTVWAWNRP